MATREWDTSFGALLAQLRKEAGLTQEELADRSGLSARSISSLECGIRHPRRFTLDRLTDALNLVNGQRTAMVAAVQQDRRAVTALDEGTTASPEPPPDRLVGRVEELAELREHLTGPGPAVLIYDGESGIGKTRLLAEAATLGAGLGMPVLSGSCRRGAEAYAPLAEALAEYVRRTPAGTLATQVRGCSGLEVLLPELEPAPSPAGGSGEQNRRLAFDAVARFLDNVAGDGRLLLVLDDLQWAGPDATELLVHLVRRAWPYLRVVTACRSGEAPAAGPLAQATADLARRGQVRGRPLAPLPPAEADALVSAIAAGSPLPEPRRVRVLRRAGGLPLFLVELTRAALGGTDDVPWHLRVAVGQQLASLPTTVLRLVREMALLGPTPAIDRALAGPDADGLLDRLEVACRYRVLEETRQGMRFRYPLVRETLTGGLGATRRRLYRRRHAAAPVVRWPVAG